VQAVYGRDFPNATVSINVIGSYVMGFLFIETVERLTLAPALADGHSDRSSRQLYDLLDV
jgi:fluoride exporter